MREALYLREQEWREARWEKYADACWRELVEEIATDPLADEEFSEFLADYLATNKTFCEALVKRFLDTRKGDDRLERAVFGRDE